jgi:hypothetical protein
MEATNVSEKKTSSRELLKEFNRELLSTAGYTAAQLAGFGELSQLSLQSLEALISQKAVEALGEQLRKKKLRVRLLSPKKRRPNRRARFPY